MDLLSTDLKNIYETTSEGIVLLDGKSGEILYINPALLELLGSIEGDFLGKKVWEINAVSEIRSVRSSFDEMQKNGVAYVSEVKLVSSSGTIKYVDLVFQIIEKTCPIIQCVLHDITSRMENAKQTHDRMIKLDEAQNVGKIGLWSLDLKNMTIDWSSGTKEIFDLAPDSPMPGMDEFGTYVYDEDKEFVDRQVTRQLAPMEEPSIKYIYRIKTRKNVVKYLEHIGRQTFDETGNLVELSGSIQDITERKNAENLQMAIFSIAQAATSSANLEELNRLIHNSLKQIIPIQNLLLAIYDPSTDRLNLLSTSSQNENDPGEINLARLVLHSKRSLLATRDVINSLINKSKIDGTVNYPEVWLGVPLLVNKEVLGVLGVQNSMEEEPFGTKELNLLEFVSTQIAIAIKRKKDENRIHQNLLHARAVKQTATRLNAILNIDAIVTTVCEEVLNALDFNCTWVYLFEPDSQTLNYSNSTGLPDSFQKQYKPPDHHLFEKFESHHGPVFVISDIQSHTQDLNYSFLHSLDIRTVIHVGMIQQNKLIGILSAATTGSIRNLDESEIFLLSEQAAQAAQSIVNGRLYEESLYRLKNLETLRNIDLAILENQDMSTTLAKALNSIGDAYSIDAMDVLLLDESTNRLDLIADFGFGSGFQRTEYMKFKNTPARRVIDKPNTLYIPDLRLYEVESEIKKAIIDVGFTSYLGIPFEAKGDVKGVLEMYYRFPLTCNKNWIDFTEILAGQVAIAIENARLFNNLQHSNAELIEAYDSTIVSLSQALDVRDKDTVGHSERVTSLTISLAGKMNFSSLDISYLRWGALLHDIGKMGIPDNILLKPGPLTDDEWVIMKQHPRFAYEILSNINFLSPALDIPYCHHEKWDGSGYPRKLKGEEIPITARIFAVVDVWDALCSDRPYRKAWTEEETIKYIQSLSGTHFDPQIVDTFISLISEKKQMLICN